MTPLLRRAALLALPLAGCATATGTTPRGSLVMLDPPPDAHCAPLGRLAVRMSTELLMSEDALLASAVGELRRRAALEGATHLVVSRPASRAAMAYGTTAAASAVAFRCPSSP